MMDPILQAKENELITAAVDTGGKKERVVDWQWTNLNSEGK